MRCDPVLRLGCYLQVSADIPAQIERFDPICRGSEAGWTDSEVGL